MVVSNKAQYCSVVRTGIGKTVLCLGGEVDASRPPSLTRALQDKLLRMKSLVWDSKPPHQGAPIKWVELKTSVDFRNDRDMDNFEKKLMKFWIQSFLLGVPNIIVGFRSREGRLLRLEEIETANIPSPAHGPGPANWAGQPSINFATSFPACEFRGGTPPPPLKLP